MLAGLIVVILLALLFNYTNGFHDAANAIASAVSTRALSPRVALAVAAIMNLLGSLAGTGVAVTVAKGIIDVPQGGGGLTVVFAALVGAIVWNLITWYFGLPSSSSHALIGGMVGAALAAASTVHWDSGVVGKVIVPMVVSPVVGGLLGYAVMLTILWLFRRRNPHRTGHGFRYAQWFSAASLAFGHGLQDAQKTMGIIVLALYTAGRKQDFTIPLWVVLITAVAISLGTYSGGWRIMRTLGRRIIKLDPPHGFAAEITGSTVLYLTAFIFAAPISTTHVITGAIAGVGSTRRLSAVRWGIAGNIAAAWVLTLPAAAVAGAIAYWISHLVVA